MEVSNVFSYRAESCSTSSNGVLTCTIEIYTQRGALIDSNFRVQSLNEITNQLNFQRAVVTHTITKAEYTNIKTKQTDVASQTMDESFMNCRVPIDPQPFHFFCVNRETWYLRTRNNFAFPVKDR